MNRIARLLLALPLAVGDGVVRADGQPFDPAPRATVDAAMELFSVGRFVDALEMATRVPDDDPAATKARYLRGELELLLGDAPAAKESFEAVVAKKPATAAAHAGIGRALFASGDAAAAVEPLRQAVELDGKTPRFRAWLGLARVRAGEVDAAKKDLAAAEKDGAGDVETARAVVEARLLADDLPGAERAAAAFGKARKDDPFGPFLRALCLDRAKRYDEAIAAYEQAIRLEPSFLDARRNLAIVCVTQNPLYQDTKRTTIALEQLAAYKAKGGRDPAVLRLAEILPQFAKPAPAK